MMPSRIQNLNDFSVRAGSDELDSSKTKSRRAPHVNAFTSDPRILFRHSSVIVVVGRIENWTLAWAGRIRCTLCLSIGELVLNANRDSMSLEIRNGHWVRAKLMLRRSGADSGGSGEFGKGEGIATSVLSMAKVSPELDAPTSWVPTGLFHRVSHMRRLRRLLSKLEPGLQTIFMIVMFNAQVQHRFFFQIAALDHHAYPGGLFDSSVKAAELVYRQKSLGIKERGIAALVCLFFDLGKVTQDHFEPDWPRCRFGLTPYLGTALLLGRALDAVGRYEPELVACIRRLLDPSDWTEWLAPPGVAPTLKQHIHQAIQQAWHIDPAIASGQGDSTLTGEQK
jgi:hypothetical protein